MPLDDSELRKILSKNIKSARLSCNITQEKLAEMCNISVNFLKDIESCRSGVSLLTLINLCNSLNTTPNELLKDFFKANYNDSKNLLQQINFLNSYQREAIYTLIQYFKNTD